MGSTIPQLTLFPLYRGGSTVTGNRGISANSSFYLPATEFTPSYGVNVRSSSGTNRSYALDGNGSLQKAGSSGSSFAQPLGFDGTVLGGLKKTAVPSVAPVIPNLYEQAAKMLSISDLKMSELLSQPSFSISNLGPGTGLGVHVKTDGAGGVDSVSLQLDSYALNPNISTQDPYFGGPKMAEITTGAIFKTSIEPGLGNLPASNVKALPSVSNTTLANPLLATNAVQGVPQNPFLQPLDGLDLGLGNANLTSILQRLEQLQPPEVGLPVSGFESALGFEEARQLAASQAKLDVITDAQVRQNVASLASAASRQSTESYVNAFKQANLDGRIPMAPSLPAATQSAGQSGAGQEGFSLNANLSDANDKKGSGGYIPFQMQSNTQGGFSAGNPFMTAGGFAQQSNQNQQQRRRLPAFVA